MNKYLTSLILCTCLIFLHAADAPLDFRTVKGKTYPLHEMRAWLDYWDKNHKGEPIDKGKNPCPGWEKLVFTVLEVKPGMLFVKENKPRSWRSALKNFPAPVKAGQTITVFALKVGTLQVPIPGTKTKDNMALYDYGIQFPK